MNATATKTTKAAKAATKPATKKPAAKQAAAKSVAKKPAAKVPAKAPIKASVKASVKAPVKAPAKAPAKAAAPKAPKLKLVRDSFTMPSDEYAALAELKQRALGFAHPAKKSELLRAGIKLLTTLGEAAFMLALKSVPAIKTGRPKSKKGA